MKKRILILATYPIKKPYHGGQHRVAQLVKAYQRSGLETKSVAVYEPEGYGLDEIGIDDISFPVESKYRLYQRQNILFITDYLSSNFILSDNLAKARLIKIFNKFNPDYIHVEHPWLYPVAKFLKNEYKNNLIVINGSANIEHILKRKIFENMGIKVTDTLDKILISIKSLEIDSANSSDMTIVVSESDMEWFKKNTKAKNILLVPNGVPSFVETNISRDEIVSEIKCNKYFLFVASAHPPNIEGFRVFVGDSLGCLPPDVKLVVAGSISEHIVPYLLESKYRFLNESRLHSVGKIEQEKLQALIKNAHGIIVPISSGGGTNLKTAEAIYSGKYLIVSEKGFRGYDKFRKLSGISVVKNRNEFRKTMSKVSLQKSLVRKNNERSLAKEVTWEYVTKPLVKYINIK